MTDFLLGDKSEMPRGIRLPTTDTEKQCGQCKNFKTFDQFYSNRRNKHTDRCKECVKSLDPAIKRDANLRRNHGGLTSKEYNQMYEAQNGVCASCGHAEEVIHYGKTLPLAVDHCHTTDAIRGLLCASCNQALGHLREDPERIKALLKYVEERVLW